MKRGFTLIELLVVIAIIGILASIVLTSLASARAKARDVARAQALRQIVTAVEMYYSDNGVYPNSNGNWASFDAPSYVATAIINPNAANLTAALSKYTSPQADPKSLGGDSGYLYVGGGQNYCVLIYRTPEDMNSFPKNKWAPARCPLTSTITNGQCVGGTNAIYHGVGTYAGGC